MTALLVLVSLLFSQLALANYRCPAADDAIAMAQMMSAGQPCEGMDADQPVLCHQHAVGVAQSFEVIKLATPSLPAIVQMIAMPLVPVAARAPALPAARSLEARPPPDPLFLRTLRLRV